MVGGGDASGVQRASDLVHLLGGRDYNVDLVVLNRLFLPEPGDTVPVRAPHTEKRTGAHHEAPSGEIYDEELLTALRRIREDAREMNERRLTHAREVFSILSQTTPILALPKTTTPLADAAALKTWYQGAVPVQL